MGYGLTKNHRSISIVNKTIFALQPRNYKNFVGCLSSLLSQVLTLWETTCTRDNHICIFSDSRHKLRNCIYFYMNYANYTYDAEKHALFIYVLFVRINVFPIWLILAFSKINTVLILISYKLVSSEWFILHRKRYIRSISTMILFSQRKITINKKMLFAAFQRAVLIAPDKPFNLY